MSITPDELDESFITIFDEINNHQIKTVCLTSTSPHEGVTTIACAMAKAVAASHHKVLYCDFGNYETSLSKRLNKVFVETKEAPLKQVRKNIYPVEALGFSLLPSPVADSPLFNKEVITKWIDTLKEEFDLIIFDTHHYNSHNTTVNIAQLTDASILIVLSGGVAEDEVKQTVDKMLGKKIKVLGFIMNDLNYPKLIDELCEATHTLDPYTPKLSEKLRNWLNQSSLLKTEI